MKLGRRDIIIAAVAVAAVGFLSIHDGGTYLFVDAMYGEIWLTGSCPVPVAESGDALDRLLAKTKPSADPVPGGSERWQAPSWPSCDLILPYRWLLAGCVVVIAGALIGWRGKGSEA